ncbi:hypothetical protein SAMCFNEI73_pC1064 (plasmid) [Sinorhizobium americanum]|uniref:Uncharacterized protein n=1 Tax=Sinorhizobium americanum TaxID=194963 RepID=A0A1L3LXJ3_9HYPH|nr:hypothetical protein SAMCFNEI73_pC1064 [Sinorhizobium americanum]
MVMAGVLLCLSDVASLVTYRPTGSSGNRMIVWGELTG